MDITHAKMMCHILLTIISIFPVKKMHQLYASKLSNLHSNDKIYDLWPEYKFDLVLFI